MLTDFRYKLAVFIAPQLENEIQKRAEALAPRLYLDSYQCKFHDSTENCDDNLTDQERKEMELWAKTNVMNPWFKYFIRWCMDTQANFVLRHATTERHADFGRATIHAFETLENEVDRLAENFERRKQTSGEFDVHSTGITE